MQANAYTPSHTPHVKSAPQDIPAPSTLPYSNPQAQAHNILQCQDDLIQQIESLEQALALQINKRIEAENKYKIQYQCNQKNTMDNNCSNGDQRGNENSITVKVQDLLELTQAFVSEVDGLDGDEEEEKMDRKDVIWMLNEIHLRSDSLVKAAPANVNDKSDRARSASNENNTINDVDHGTFTCADIQEEMDVAILQGTIAQLQETNERLQRKYQNDAGSGSVSGSSGKHKHTSEVWRQYTLLQEKHSRLEQRHGNIMKEMQESLNSKNQEIAALKKSLKADLSASPSNNANNNNNNNGTGTGTSTPKRHMDSPQSKLQSQASIKTPLPVTYADKPDSIPMNNMSPMSPFFTSPHKDLQIASLQEEIEDRNQVIEELQTELDGFVVKTNVQSMEADKVKIKYLESIIHNLKEKLNIDQKERQKHRATSQGSPAIELNGGSAQKNSPRARPAARVRSPPIYGSMAWNMGMELDTGWGDSCSNLVDKNLTLAPGAVQSSMMEDMELQIAELMERLRIAEEENCKLKHANEASGDNVPEASCTQALQ